MSAHFRDRLRFAVCVRAVCVRFLFRFPRRLAFALVLASSALSPLGAAAAYPDHSITIVVPYGPGTSMDLLARTLGRRMAQDFGQAVVIENRPGAVASIGTAYVAHAKPDGYTILINGPGGIINQLATHPSVDLRRDLTPVALTGISPLAIAVSSTLPVNSLADVIALARAHPGTLSYATNGPGFPGYIGGGLAKSQHVDIREIPYKSTTDALTDVISGRVTILVTPVASAIPLTQSGKLRALAVTGDVRQPSLGKDVPTIKQAGFGDVDGVIRFFMFAPAGTPRPVLERLNAEFAQAQSVKSVADELNTQGVFPKSATLPETEQLFKDEFALWTKAAL